MTDDSLKPVSMHEAFKRDPDQRDAERIVYVKLEGAADESKSKEYAFLRKVWESPSGSLEEEKWARRAAVGYLVLTSAQLQRGIISERPIVSERFTQSSIELYGQPDVFEVQKLVAAQLQEFRKLVGDERVDQELLKSQLDYLENQAGDSGGNIDVQQNTEELNNALSLIKEVIIKRYGHVLSIFEDPKINKLDKVPPELTKQLFQRGIDMLAEDDPAWAGWKAIIKAGTSSMDTDSRLKQVNVGSNYRAPATMLVSFIHEVIAHAMQAVNGSKTGDELLEHGMPGSHRAHEGLAIFLAASFRGAPSDRSKDFYMDIAFALGQLGQPPVSRPKLQKLYLDRMVIRTQAASNPVNTEDLSSKAWGYVNRIFRGSLGNDILGVNTIDIDYYHGFIGTSPFVQEELREGITADEIFDYLTSANFDPDNPSHARYREEILSRLKK